MAEQPINLPEGMSTLTPHLVCDGVADAIEFYKQAFGAIEMTRLPGPDGRVVHATITIHGSPVMLADENKERGVLGPKALGGTPVTLHQTVPDVDAAFKRAIDTGATEVMPPTDMFWGDRYGIVTDPWGHAWSLATPQRTEPMSQDEMAAAMANAQPNGAR